MKIARFVCWLLPRLARAFVVSLCLLAILFLGSHLQKSRNQEVAVIAEAAYYRGVYDSCIVVLSHVAGGIDKVYCNRILENAKAYDAYKMGVPIAGQVDG